MEDEQKKKTITNHIKQRINDANLKPEEIKAIDKARSQVFTQTMAGGFLGSIGIFMLGRRRRLNPFLMIPFVGGGFMLGSQLGMVSGIMAGKRTIEKLPDQTRLINLVKDIQKEVMEANGYTRDVTSSNDVMTRPRPMTPEEKQEYEQRQVSEQRREFNDSKNNDNESSVWWSDDIGNNTNNSEDTFMDNNWPGETPTGDAADDNLSTWDKIRENNKKQ